MSTTGSASQKATGVETGSETKSGGGGGVGGGGVGGGSGGASYPQASLYVGDLAPEVQESALFQKFSSIGPVMSIRICRDAVTKASLGYGYVNYGRPEHAEKAMEELNFEPVGGRPLRLMWSHRDPTLRRNGQGNIFIKNLDKAIDNKSLHDTFASFGKILSCKVARNDEGVSRGFAFVHYATPQSAKDAIVKVNGMLLHDKKVFVGEFKTKASRQAELGCPKFTNVYIKNLGPETTEEQLRALAAEFGTVSSLCVPMEAEGKRARGFAFVAYDTADAATAAVDGLNGREAGSGAPEGQRLFAGRAMKKEERANQLRCLAETKKREAAKRHQGVNLYVKNLEDDMTEEALRAEFAKYGPISSAKIMTSESGLSRGFGFVCFASPDDANKAVTEMNGRVVNKKPLYVALAQRKEERKAQLATQFMNARYHSSRGPPPAHVGLYTAQSAAHNYYLSNTGYPNSTPAPSAPAFVPNARVSGPTAGRWGAHYSAAPAPYNSRSAGYPPAAPNGPPRSTRPTYPQQHTATRIIQGMHIDQGARGGVWGAPGGYGLHFNQATRNRPIDAAAPTHYASIAAAAPPQFPGADANHAGKGASAAEQKQLLGEELYNLVAQHVDDASAGKVTGMLLEMANNEIVTLLHQPKNLAVKIDEAMLVLKSSGIPS